MFAAVSADIVSATVRESSKSYEKKYLTSKSSVPIEGKRDGETEGERPVIRARWLNRPDLTHMRAGILGIKAKQEKQDTPIRLSSFVRVDLSLLNSRSCRQNINF